jgi:ATP-binding protein involved in chromosome partitioning
MVNRAIHGEQDQKIREKMEKIKKKIIVLSNKGGVGKSTVAVNLAYGLSTRGYKVGLLDSDIHGPSIPKMLGLEGVPLVATEEQEILPPAKNDNLVVLSIGMALQSDDTPVIWRGPLKINAMKQFLGDTIWGELDYFIVDLPPGTGDEALNIAQLLENDLNGAVIVTTPQEVALLDVKKAISFVKKLNIPVLGFVVNMSYLICPQCGEKIELFGSLNKVEDVSQKLDVDILGYLPFNPKVSILADEGVAAISDENNFQQEFNKVIDKLLQKLQE